LVGSLSVGRASQESPKGDSFHTLVLLHSFKFTGFELGCIQNIYGFSRNIPLFCMNITAKPCPMLSVCRRLPKVVWLEVSPLGAPVKSHRKVILFIRSYYYTHSNSQDLNRDAYRAFMCFLVTCKKYSYISLPNKKAKL